MQGKEILRLVDSLQRDKDIDKEIIFQAIESALQSAARKHFGSMEDIEVDIDRETGEVAAIRDEERMDPQALGRIAAQTAKQVIIQRVREAERDIIYEQYDARKGKLVAGTVQRFQSGSMVIDLERTEAYIPRSQQVRSEHYQPGDRIRAVVLDVQKAPQKVTILLSRKHPDLIKRLFELEVPEIADGVVEIVKIAREAGQRTKLAVKSNDARVDSVGACVGVRGTRIKSIIDELQGEKIDIVPWNEAPEILIADTLKPAEVLQITLEEGETTKRAVVTVPEDQLSLAIGRKGQNVRLAVQLTGWNIDIQAPGEEEEEEETGAEEQAAEETAEETTEAEETEEEVAEEAEAEVEEAEEEEEEQDEETEESEEDEEAEPEKDRAPTVEAEEE